jgi:hypothetical protein
MSVPGFSRRMPAGERFWLNLVFLLLWVTGSLWLVLDLWFATNGEFGVTPHPWQPPLLLLHGVIAVPALYLCGWMSARHATLKWKLQLRRTSGMVFAAFLLLLALSGFALFFLTQDAPQRFAALTHEAAGVLFTLPILEHWFIGRPREDA